MIAVNKCFYNYNEIFMYEYNISIKMVYKYSQNFEFTTFNGGYKREAIGAIPLPPPVHVYNNLPIIFKEK